MVPKQMNRRTVAFEALEQRLLFSASPAADGDFTLLTFGNFHPTQVQLPLGILITGEGSLTGTVAGKNFSAQVGTFNLEIGPGGLETRNSAASPVEVALQVCWGDGTTSGGGFESIALGNGETATGVTGSHTYSQAGTFNVTVFCSVITEGGAAIFGQCASVVDVTPSPTAIYHAPVSTPADVTAAAPSGGVAAAVLGSGSNNGSAVGQNILQSSGADQILG